MTNASFVPTTATSFGLSACATADGRTRAASSVTSAIRVAMPGLYGRLGRSDLPEPQADPDQHESEEGDRPQRSPGERQRGCPADAPGRGQDALGLAVARRRRL